MMPGSVLNNNTKVLESFIMAVLIRESLCDVPAEVEAAQEGEVVSISGVMVAVDIVDAFDVVASTV